jgi:hypothetical protein
LARLAPTIARRAARTPAGRVARDATVFAPQAVVTVGTRVFRTAGA